MKNNIGKVWLKRGLGPWSSTLEDPPVKIDEFEQKTREFDAYIEGFLCGNGKESSLMYLQGDFFEERTHTVFVQSDKYRDEFQIALQKRLKIHRFRNWRIVMIAEKGASDAWVIYPDAVVKRESAS